LAAVALPPTGAAFPFSKGENGFIKLPDAGVLSITFGKKFFQPGIGDDGLVSNHGRQSDPSVPEDR
jgi:hypothetical protein